MIRKLLLKTEPRLDMVVPAKLMSVTGEKLPKAEFKSFDIAQTAKQTKAQINNVTESDVIPPSPKDVAARASIIVDNGAIRMHGEKPVPHRLISDSAGAIQTSESNNGSGAQNSGNKGDGGGFDPRFVK